MTSIFATATFATASTFGEVVLYEPISKIGGASSFTRNPQRFASVASGAELMDDDSVILTDDDDTTLTDG